MRRRERGNALALTLVAVLGIGAAVAATTGDTLLSTSDGRSERCEFRADQALRGAAEGLRLDLGRGREPRSRWAIGGTVVRVRGIEGTQEWRLTADVPSERRTHRRSVTVRMEAVAGKLPRISSWNE